jgi:hypothetical protein
MRTRSTIIFVSFLFWISSVVYAESSNTQSAPRVAVARTEEAQLIIARIRIADTNEVEDQRVISETFERFAVVEPNQSDVVARTWSADASETREDRLFGTTFPEKLSVLAPGRYVSIFSDYLAFESIPFVFAVWEAQADSLVFLGFLDHYIRASMAVLRIDEVLRLSESEALIQGSSAGGDAGDVNGSLWFAHWRSPLNLDVVFRADWMRSQHETNVERRVVHELDRQGLRLTIMHQERYILYEEIDGGSDREPFRSSWVNRVVDTVDLRSLLKDYESGAEG